MIDALINLLIEYVRQLGGVGVLLGVLLETFIVPIPSPLIPVSAGFILVPSDASLYETFVTCFVVIALFGSFGATVGAFFGYVIGYYGGHPLIEKYGRYIGIAWEDVEKVEEKLGKKQMKEIALFLFRAVPVIPLSPVSFFAGFIRYNILKFAVLTLIGSLPRYFILGLVGWWAGVAYRELVETIGFIETLVLAAMAVGIVGLFIFKKSSGRLRKERNNPNPYRGKSRRKSPAATSSGPLKRAMGFEPHPALRKTFI